MPLTPEEARRRAEQIARAYASPRYRRLDELERYAAGTQYVGRPSFWSDSVPLNERAPCIRAPIVERAIRGLVDLCLGEGRFPRLTSHASEDDTVFDDERGLDEESSRLLDRFTQNVADQARLPAVSDDLMTAGLECGTAVAIACARDARLVVETVRAKDCEPTLSASGECRRLEIRYPYVQEVKVDDRWSFDCLLYRRVIDDRRDVTYYPARASENGAEPDFWREDPARTFEHNLGFCPVVWWRRARRCTTVVDVDGVAPHAALLAEIDGLNFSLSQRHRAARYAGDPQLVEYGAPEDTIRAPMGRESRTMYAGEGDHPANRTILLGPTGQPMRRRGPGAVWSYDQPGAKVEYLALPAGALESLTGDARELYAMLRDALGYVDLDPAHIRIGGDVSGRTLEWLFQGAINHANRLRPDFADGCLLPLVSLLLRLALVLHRRGEMLLLPGLDAVRPVLESFELPTAGGTTRWLAPSLRCVWGPYFGLSEADKKAKQDRVLDALDRGVVTLQTAVEEIACLYPTIKDPGAYVEALAKEKAEKQGSLHAARKVLDEMGGEDEEPKDEPDKGVASMREQGGAESRSGGDRPGLDLADEVGSQGLHE
jgi:hypothetical protein